MLGTVRVTITLSDSGDVSAQLNASTDLGRRLLDSGLPRLATALAERGVDVGQLNVAVGGHDDSAGFFDHSQGWQSRERPIWQPATAVGLFSDGESVEPVRLISDGHHLIDLLA